MLHLAYFEEEGAAAAASTWTLLPQLRGLDLNLLSADLQRRAATLAGVAAATQLTSLHFDYFDTAGMPPEFAMRLCGGLTGLRGLRVLSLRSVHLAPGDVLALTALTGLTRLEFVDMCKIGEVQAAAHAIIRSLKHLKCLRMQSCHVDLSSTALLLAS